MFGQHLLRFRRVALLAEGVDRNLFFAQSLVKTHHVALLAEGVDRNKDVFNSLNSLNVALLAEGVDRNGVVGV